MRFTYVLVLIPVALAGCNDPHQRAWLYTMVHAGSEVDDSGRHNGAPIETKRLIEIVGEPDLKMATQGFLAGVRGDTTYQSYVKSQLQKAFGRYRSHAGDQRVEPQHEPDSINDCTIWLYDESKRFQRPYRTSANVGYGAYLFLVCDSRVIGAACAHDWRGIDTGSRLQYQRTRVYSHDAHGPEVGEGPAH